MPVYVYRLNKSGEVKPVQVADKIPLRGAPLGIDKNFHQQVLDAYKQSEAQGDRWQGPFPKGMVRRIHETAMARTGG